MQTIIIEKTEQNIPYIMSLPITVRVYTLAKVIAKVLIFCWLRPS